MQFDLITANKQDSQDICFVPDGKYAKLISKLNPSVNKKGKILHIDGYELGEHEGIISYTIGQRKGLGIATGKPLYVIKLDADKNIVYVGSYEDLNKTSFVISKVNWLGDNWCPGEEKKWIVKIRSNHQGSYAKMKNLGEGKMSVCLFEPEKSITPGQACVIYDNTRVLGGGWIDKF